MKSIISRLILLIVSTLCAYLFLKFTNYELESHTQVRIYKAIENAELGRFQVLRFPHILTELFVNYIGRFLKTTSVTSPFTIATYLLNSLSFGLLVLVFYIFIRSLGNSRIKSLVLLLTPIILTPVFVFTFPNAEDNFGYIGFLAAAFSLFYHSYKNQRFLRSIQYWIAIFLLFICVGLNATNFILLPLMLLPIWLNENFSLKKKILSLLPMLGIAFFVFSGLSLYTYKLSSAFAFLPRIIKSHTLIAEHTNGASFLSDLTRGLTLIFYRNASYFSPFLEGGVAISVILILIIFIRQKLYKDTLCKYILTILFPIIIFSLIYEPWSIERWDYFNYLLSIITIVILSDLKKDLVLKILLIFVLTHNFASTIYSLHFMRDAIYDGKIACSLHQNEKKSQEKINSSKFIVIDYRYNIFLPRLKDQYGKAEIVLARNLPQQDEVTTQLPSNNEVLLNKWPPKKFHHIHSCLISPNENCFKTYPETEVKAEELSDAIYLPFPISTFDNCMRYFNLYQ